MAERLIYQYLQHPKRNWMTWGAAILAGLLLILPAWDELSAAKLEGMKLQSDLTEKTRSLANKDLMQNRMNQLETQPVSTQKMIDAESAQRLREDVTHLVRKMNCQMTRLTVSEPRVRPWAENDNPLRHFPPENMVSTKFRLETRDLNLTVTGKLRQLGELIVELNRLDQFSVPIEMTLQRETVNGQLRLNVHVSLFNLVESND